MFPHDVARLTLFDISKTLKGDTFKHSVLA